MIERSEIVWRQTGVFRDARKHARADVVVIVKGEDVVLPTGS
jgi:hypothetical protein